jgi:hypothetical protein
MTDHSFSRLCDRLVGAWSGQRDGTDLERERVRSVWKKTLDGSFLQEDWYTSGTGNVLMHRATALFGIADGMPGAFFAAYNGGAIAHGDSELNGGVWVLIHRWLESGDRATITLQLLDDDTYRQEVFDLEGDDAPRLESRALLVRE